MINPESFNPGEFHRLTEPPIFHGRQVSTNTEISMSTFYRKRVFLSPISTGYTSYILTEVESSRGGENKWGHCMITMADCRRRIQLEFFLGTIRARRESLRKIDLLIKQLEQFRTALRAEANLIHQYEAKPKSKSGKTKSSHDASDRTEGTRK